MAKATLFLKSNQTRTASCSFVIFFIGTALVTTAIYPMLTMVSLLTFNSQHVSEAIPFLNSVHGWGDWYTEVLIVTPCFIILTLLETDFALRKSGSRLCSWPQSHQRNQPILRDPSWSYLAESPDLAPQPHLPDTGIVCVDYHTASGSALNGNGNSHWEKESNLLGIWWTELMRRKRTLEMTRVPENLIYSEKLSSEPVVPLSLKWLSLWQWVLTLPQHPSKLGQYQ